MDEAYRRVVSLSQQYPYWGYRKIYDLLRGEVAISRERVRLIRRREGLQVVRKRRKRRLLGTTTQWVHRACFPNHVWSYDFVFDQTEDARQLKCLTVVDEFTRQGLTIRIGRGLTAGDVIRILDELFHEHGRPACLRSDNGSETGCGGGAEMAEGEARRYALHRSGQSVAERVQREFQFDLSYHLPGSLAV